MKALEKHFIRWQNNISKVDFWPTRRFMIEPNVATKQAKITHELSPLG